MFGVLFPHASIVFVEFYFGESKEPSETRVIKFSRKLSILQYSINQVAFTFLPPSNGPAHERVQQLNAVKKGHFVPCSGMLH